jgi:hypothetical protein
MSVHVQKVSFNSGELDPLMDARVNVEKYESGCRKLENFVLHTHGPVSRRPGMEYIGLQDDQATASRFIEFNFSATTKALIEMTSGEFCIWSNGVKVPLLTPATHPYLAAEFFAVQVKQINDVVYLAHPNHPPRKLSRLADDNWKSEEIVWKYPPLLDENVEDEIKINPVVTELWRSQLSEAEEFEVPVLNDVPVTWAEIGRSGVTDTAWFELLTSENEVPLTLEAQKADGTWVSIASVTAISTRMEFAFQPASSPSTTLRVRRRTWNGSSWGAWENFGSTVASFLPTASTVANITNIKFRWRKVWFYNNQADASTFGIKPISTYFNGPMAELAPSGGYYYLSDTYWADGAVSPFVQVAFYKAANAPEDKPVTAQIWNGSAWATFKTFDLDDTGGVNQPFRFNVIVFNEGGTLKVMEGATVLYSAASTEEGPWQCRLYTAHDSPGATATIAIGGGGSVHLVPPFETIHGTSTLEDQTVDVGRSQSAASDALTGGVTVEADAAWQAVVQITDADEIPAGAKVTLQRKVNGTWGKIVEQTITDGEVGKDIIIGGKTYTTDTLVRAIYTSTSGERTLGTMWIETVEFPASETTKLKLSSTSGNNRTLTASGDLFVADHVGSYWQIVHRRDLSYTEIVGVVGAFPKSKLTSAPLRVVGNWDVFTYGTWRGKLFLEQRIAGDKWQVLRTWSSNKDRNVTASGTTDTDVTLRLRAESMTGVAASGAAVPRFLLEIADSRVYGLVKITSITSPTVAVVDVIRPAHSTEDTIIWSEGAWSDKRGYPSALALHEQRLWFGGSAHQPATVWASVAGDFENFRRTTADDGSIALTLAAEASGSVRWLSSAPGSLLIGTAGDEWALRSTSEGGITTLTAKAEVQSSYSSAYLPARRANDVTLFIQRDGRRIRQMTFADGQQGFVASDVTVLASHVTKGGIRQLAFQQTPTAIIWCVTASGQLIGMTFEKDQNVFGWHRHITDGAIETVAVLHGTPSDEVWVGVRRTVAGATVRTLERMTFQETDSGPSRLFYLDGAKKYEPTSPLTVCTGLAHLNGKSVLAMVDGVQSGPYTVSGGQITLAVPANKPAIVGLPYTSTVQPMKQEVSMQDGTAQGRTFKLVDATVRVDKSLGGEVSADPADSSLRWVAIGLTGSTLLTTQKRVKLESRHQKAVNVAIRSASTYPLTVTALTLSFDVHGT